MEGDELQYERQRLRETQAVIQAQLDRAARESDHYAKTIREIQEERQESDRADNGGLYSAQGFAELLETSQGAQTLTQITDEREKTERTIRTLLRMRENPYFARIDFLPDGGETRQIYIGRATLMDGETMRIHVYDWRVPIAGVFYQYGVGPAEYVAPAGTVRGDVLIKRQYEIRGGELLYFFDANEEVRDTFLRDLLSRPAAPAMKSIVETIQRGQDQIIRDTQADLLLVQGCAGSGKTSVALHRVAYLMYQGLTKGRLSPHDILILAPNAAFERYISQVLPDLGEKQVRTMLPEDLLSGVLTKTAIEPRGAWVERLLTEPDGSLRDGMRLVNSVKGSAAFLSLLDRLVYELPRKWIPFADVMYAGQTVATAEQLRVSVCNSNKKAPLGKQLRALEKSVWTQIHALRPARYAKLLDFAVTSDRHAAEVQPFARMLSIRESGRLLAHIRAFTRIDCAALYRTLFADKAAFHRLAAGLLPPEAVEPVRLSGPTGSVLPYEDAAAIAYLEARVNGCRAYAHLRQVVVDEAQDLDALHAALLRLLFPNARFTLLGDIHQTLAGPADPALYDTLRDALQKPNSLPVTLDKSFRHTREIWAFSARFLPPGEAGECFSRSGEAPSVHGAPDDDTLDALLLSHARQCLADGHQTVALLCKTERDAKRLYQRLQGEADVALIGPDDAVRHGRVSILPLYMAKGLEFDAVLLYGVDASRYRDDADGNLLYVGCTRALHVLRLYYTGEKSPLLPESTEVNA